MGGPIPDPARDAFLDAGSGQCWLRKPGIARIVEDVLFHFDGERYRLIAWAVMPNHVHSLIEPISGHGLGSIVSSWKRFSARMANRVLGRTGPFWQDDYWDTIHPHRTAFRIDDQLYREQSGQSGAGEATGRLALGSCPTEKGMSATGVARSDEESFRA